MCSLKSLLFEAFIHAHEMLRFCQPSKLVLVDCWREDVWPHRSDFERQMRERFAGDERVLIVKATSVDAAREFVDGTFDATYIDADHDEAAATKDLTAWWPKLKRGGIFCGHDYIDPP